MAVMFAAEGYSVEGIALLDLDLWIRKGFKEGYHYRIKESIRAFNHAEQKKRCRPRGDRDS